MAFARREVKITVVSGEWREARGINGEEAGTSKLFFRSRALWYDTRALFPCLAAQEH